MKKGKFSMNVVADDRTIEKKDRTVNEPMQFYTGRDRSLYEVVVMTADKNSVTGYMSTPKNVRLQETNFAVSRWARSPDRAFSICSQMVLSKGTSAQFSIGI